MASKSVSQWEEMFLKYDKDSNGTLDIHELKSLLEEGDSTITDDQLQQVFTFFDGTDGDKRITLEEFKAGMQKVQDRVVTLTALFNKYSKHEPGYLSTEELDELLAADQQEFCPEENDSLLQKVNAAGKISQEEFINICT
ncbi:calmodulin-4-like [Physella acuta]|uniref:calmodulin-4-like n=1 Tax=Physella acuta TaxID=109671 RepID=UPI0027DAF316|nr:calmodulin-4-like [Physella acuta]